MSSETRPLRVAVVGAGPAGLYTADQLTCDPESAATVDIFERLPIPFGLLRYGVAPDHPTIKSASGTFQEILDREQVGLFCNVDIGSALAVNDLREWYDAVVYATGADQARPLEIEGEDLPGSISATEFVKWYNGHPEARDQNLRQVRNAVVVGAGNVALDVARILLKDPAALSETDVPASVLTTLADSAVTDVHLIARRGPEHARFTTKELRELGELGGVDVVVDSSQVPDVDPEGLGPVGRRNLKVLREWSTRASTNAARRVHLHFSARPHQLIGETAVRGVVVDTGGALTEISADIVIRSIGYRSRPLSGVPFDELSGTIPHIDHRVRRDGTVSPGEYAVGWVKRGPSGVLGSNRGDAMDTVEAIIADMGAQYVRGPVPSIEEELSRRGIEPLNCDSWDAICRAEYALGASLGRERVKINAWESLIAAGRSIASDTVDIHTPTGLPTRLSASY